MYFKLKLPRKSGWYTQFFTTGWRSISFASSAASSAASSGTACCSSRMRVFSNGVYITTPSALAVARTIAAASGGRSEEHTSELQSRLHLVCRLLLEKKKKTTNHHK